MCYFLSMSFGNNLKQFRIENRLKQTQLAKMLNLNNYVISDWENGRSEPCIDDLKKLCVIFNISLDELLDFDTEFKRAEVAQTINYGE